MGVGRIRSLLAWLHCRVLRVPSRISYTSNNTSNACLIRSRRTLIRTPTRIHLLLAIRTSFSVRRGYSLHTPAPKPDEQGSKYGDDSLPHIYNELLLFLPSSPSTTIRTRRPRSADHLTRQHNRNRTLFLHPIRASS